MNSLFFITYFIKAYNCFDTKTKTLDKILSNIKLNDVVKILLKIYFLEIQ